MADGRLSTQELLTLAAATRQRLADAAGDLSRLTAELRRRVDEARAAGQDDPCGSDDINDLHVEHLHVHHLHEHDEGNT